MINNLLPAYGAQANTMEALGKIKEADNFSSYVNIVYEVIRSQSRIGKLAVEINLSHKRVKQYPIEAVSILLGQELTQAGYNIQYRQTGRKNKRKTIIIYWGVPEEKENGGMGGRA